jgi:hypothetical protein
VGLFLVTTERHQSSTYLLAADTIEEAEALAESIIPPERNWDTISPGDIDVHPVVDLDEPMLDQLPSYAFSASEDGIVLHDAYPAMTRRRVG